MDLIFEIFSLVLLFSQSYCVDPGESNIVDVYTNILTQDLVEIRDLEKTDDDFIHVVLIVIFDEKGKRNQKILKNLEEMLISVLQHSIGTPIHFIILTNITTKEIIRHMELMQIVSLTNESAN